ncbi:hypothetical protein EDD85DRAFT_987726 [Armillaria nabsnona]|nr:hypothetical protein EDD85DRAFT_987726 [Armillaria nabsnona]
MLTVASTNVNFRSRMVAMSGLLQRNVKNFVALSSTAPTIISVALEVLGPVSAEEEAWLDEAGNFVDEDIVIEKLESASDFGVVFKNLNTSQRHAYDRLESQINKFRKPSAKRKDKPCSNCQASSLEKHTEGRCDSGKAQAKKGKGAPTATSKQLGKLATMQQHIEVLDWYHANGKNQSKTARHFNTKYPHLKIKQLLVSAWVKAEDKWREEYEKCGANGHKTKRIRQSQHPEITNMMDLWVTKAMADSLLLTGEVLCQKWKAFAGLRGILEDERLGLSKG